MPSNQKKVRDIERAIKKFGSTPELLAKLEEAKHGKEEVLLNEKRRKNATKYHMVKFLERKKMTRMIRSTESKLKQATNEEAKNRLSKLRDRQMHDLAYVMYYPIEHKYIALFPSAEKDTKGQEVDADGKQDAEKSKQLSKKARQLALERWNTEKQNVADGVEGAVDKVAYAMEVEYKGGVAAAEGRTQLPKQTPAKAAQSSASKTKNTLLVKANTRTNASSSSSGGTSNKPVQNQSDKDASDSSGSDSGSDSDSDSDDDNKQTATKAKPSKVSGSRDSDSESDSSSDSSDSDSNSSSGGEKTKKNTVKPAVKKPTTTTSATASTKEEKEKKDEKDESEEDAGDDFFMEEASDSEILAQAGKNTQPKVYNDGNDFRYKGERQSVHEIRFAATKRKYERHKRVFNNQNKRNSAQERKKSRN